MKRFFHIRLPNKPSKGGATVCVSTAQHKDYDNAVRVQVAFCSPDDGFWRAQGRLLAEHRAARVVDLKDLPQELSIVAHRVHSMAGIPRSRREINDFEFSTKYFLPKE